MQKLLMLPLKLSQINLSNQNNQSKVEIVSLLFCCKENWERLAKLSELWENRDNQKREGLQ